MAAVLLAHSGLLQIFSDLGSKLEWKSGFPVSEVYCNVLWKKSFQELVRKREKIECGAISKREEYMSGGVKSTLLVHRRYLRMLHVHE